MKLNEKQQKLVTDNYNLLYDYQHKFNISEEDVDLLMIGLCKAAATYNGSAAFSTYAYKCMRTEIYYEWRKRKSVSAIPIDKTVHYNKHIDDSGTELLDIIANSMSDNFICEKLLCEEVSKELEATDRLIFRYLRAGYRQTEIAQKLGVSRQRINQRVQKIRDIVMQHLYE